MGLKLQDIHVYFNRGTPMERHAIAGLNLTVGAGECVSIIGSNGAGKSTLFQVISGEIQVDAGQVWIANQDCTLWPDYKRAAQVAKVMQDPQALTMSPMSIAQNMALALLRGKKRYLWPDMNSARRHLFYQKLHGLNMGLEERLDEEVGNLSGGQRQALSLIMATLSDPQILLLDEHTSALDPKMAHIVMELTQKIVRESQLAVLMITHNMAYALECGDQTCVLHEGRIVQVLSRAQKQGLKPADLAAMLQGG